jgi:hypothetical protein
MSFNSGINFYYLFKLFNPYHFQPGIVAAKVQSFSISPPAEHDSFLSNDPVNDTEGTNNKTVLIGIKNTSIFVPPKSSECWMYY